MLLQMHRGQHFIHAITQMQSWITSSCESRKWSRFAACIETPPSSCILMSDVCACDRAERSLTSAKGFPIIMRLRQCPSAHPWALQLHLVLVDVPVIDTLGPHVLCEDACIRHKPSNGNADMCIHFEDLLLVRRQFRGIALKRCDQRVLIRAHANGGGPLLDRLHGILNLVDAASGRPCDTVSVVLVSKHR